MTRLVSNGRTARYQALQDRRRMTAHAAARLHCPFRRAGKGAPPRNGDIAPGEGRGRTAAPSGAGPAGAAGRV